MIEPKTDYQGKTKIKVNDKEFPLLRTTAKTAFYKDGDKERRISLSKLNDTKAEEKHKMSQKKRSVKPVEKLGLWGGHMPDVPIECNHPRKFFDNTSKTNWIDINICNIGCSATCFRYKDFKKGMGKTR